MRIVVFNSDVNFDVGKHNHGHSVCLLANTPYVIATAPFNALMQDNKSLAQLLIGSALLETRLKPFDAMAWPPERPSRRTVLFYTGAGGLGDQVMAWPAVLHLIRLGYTVDVLADPGNDVCWKIVPGVRRVVTLPTPLRTALEYDHHAIFEVVTNIDGLADQLHPTDNIFNRLGIDPRTVKLEDRLVKPVMPLKALSRRWSERPYGVFQLAATGPIRSLPPVECTRLMEQLSRETGDKVEWLAVGDQSNPDHVNLELPKHFRKVALDSFVSLTSLCAGAAVGVGPDSLLMHLCGTLDRPFVAYFGPIPPTIRTRYYRSVRAVYAQAACRVAPCFSFGFNLSIPAECPTAAQKYCKVAVDGARHVAAQVKLALAPP